VSDVCIILGQHHLASVTERVIGAGSGAHPGRVLSGGAVPRHGRCRYVRHVVTAVRVVGTRDGTHPRRVVVTGGDSIRNIGRVMDGAAVRVVGAQIWVQACGVPLSLGNDNCSQHNLQSKPSSPSGLSTRFIK
jgi:hypothetical protein